MRLGTTLLSLGKQPVSPLRGTITGLARRKFTSGRVIELRMPHSSTFRRVGFFDWRAIRFLPFLSHAEGFLYTKHLLASPRHCASVKTEELNARFRKQTDEPKQPRGRLSAILPLDRQPTYFPPP